MDDNERIVWDSPIADGEAGFNGTSVTLSIVLASLAEGATAHEILKDVVTPSEQDAFAAIAFGKRA